MCACLILSLIVAETETSEEALTDAPLGYFEHVYHYVRLYDTLKGAFEVRIRAL